MDQGRRDKIERLKEKAEFFLENNIRAFIKDYDDNYYFCDILLVGETHIYFKNFAGKREGQKDQLSWIEVDSIKEYKAERE